MQIGDLDVLVERKTIKHLILHVKVDGVVTVSAPRQTTDEAIRDFVVSRCEWIVRARQRMAQLNSVRALPEWTNREMLHKHRELHTLLVPMLDHWAAVMQVQYRGFCIKALKSKWGSCNIQTHALTFNLYLLCWPVECIEYVVVHELAHLIVPNHSPAFHAVLDHYYPSWRACKKKMRGAG